MKNFYCLLFALLVVSSAAAQDEGVVQARSRFERDKGIYVAAGPAFTLGKNLGDYSTGLGFEAGFTKRLNKVISIGPNISYLQFKYDESKTYPYYYDVTNDLAIEIALEGGDISLISAGFNVKLNLVPVSDNSVVSVYGIGTPFVSMVKRTAMVGAGAFYNDDDLDGIYDNYLTAAVFDEEDVPAFKEESKISGGVHIGFGVEIMPTKPVSFFAQATFSYTLPVKYTATESFLKPEDRYQDAAGTIYYDAETTVYGDEYPIVKNGFSALSVKAGVSFNF